MLIALLGASVSGCASTPVRPTATDPVTTLGSVPLTYSAKPAEAASPTRTVELAFEVLRVSMPLSQGRNSLKVWNHVDVLRVDSGLSARLARNGLRVGVGSKSSWSPIRAIFEAARAKSSQDQFPTMPGAPLLVELGLVADGETIFSYGKDDRLAGRTFAEGAKVMQIDYAYHTHFGGATDIQLGFEVRHDRGELVWERQGDGVIRQVQAVDRDLFPDLSVAVTLRSDEFLVVGPSEQADNEFLVGSRFLASGAAGERSETLILLTPIVFQTQAARRGG